MKNTTWTLLFLFLSPFFLVFLACSSDSSDGNVEIENGLGESYPTDLAVASPFAAGNAVEGLVKLASRDQVGAEEEPVELLPYSDRREEIIERLNGSGAGDCRFVFRLFRFAPPANCYGPGINYTNHPDSKDGTANGFSPPGDLGIWDETEEGGNACVAQKINNLVGNVQAKVDTALDLVTAMLCIAGVEGKDNLPNIGDSRNLKVDLQSVVDASLSDSTVNLASILREEDTVFDSRPSYLNQIETELRKDGKAVTLDLNLRHIPEDDSNRIYRGMLWYTLSGDLLIAGNDLCVDPTKGTQAFSISYRKTAAGTLRYSMQRAEYCDEPSDPFNPNGTLDRETKNTVDSPNPDGWVANFNEYRVLINTSDGGGKLSFGWQAGAGDGYTRAFLANFGMNDAGNSEGCGFFGYGADAAEYDGKINGMYCNWAGPNNRLIFSKKAQKQCFEFNPETKLFDSTEARISYAPVNDCETESLADDGSIFDGRENIPKDLVPVLAIDITPPKSPAN